MHLLVLNGPNLNRLGSREPDIYGSTTLTGLIQLCADWAAELGHTVDSFQSNHEGELIDKLHQAADVFDGIVLNGGALSHTSYALHDAITSIEVPTVEVHISNVMEREEWRAESRIGPACSYSIYGRGIGGYRDAIRRLHFSILYPSEPISYGPSPDQVGELRLPRGSGPHPIIVLIHGGFWRHQWALDTLDALAADLTERGFATWNIEYSRAGLGMSLASTDVALAIEHLHKVCHPLGLDMGRLGLLGHSAGAQLALEAAKSAGPALTVSLAGVTDLVRAIKENLGNGAASLFLAGRPAEAHSPAHLLPIGSPLLLAHGSADENVPIDYSNTLAKVAETAGDSVDYLRFDGLNHMDMIDPSQASWATIAETIQRSLKLG
jgi:3-dehydroquinate dehydratase type II